MSQVIHAFFDESGSHGDSPLLCVAGYAFEKRKARMMAKEWTATLSRYDLPYFHMVDCAHGNKAYASLTLRQRIKVQTRLIELVKRFAAHGFAVSVDLSAYSDLMPSWGPTNSPYAFCARSIIDEIGRWFFQIGFRGKSSFFFEAGHASRSEADEVIKRVLTNPLTILNDIHYGYQAHSFIEKRDAPAVQAADLLAWQWATDVKHEVSGRNRRKDFESLIQAPVRCCHFDEARLKNYINTLKEFGLNDPEKSIDDDANLIRIKYIMARSRGALFR